jgi:hypothetical protein
MSYIGQICPCGVKCEWKPIIGAFRCPDCFPTKIGFDLNWSNVEPKLNTGLLQSEHSERGQNVDSVHQKLTIGIGYCNKCETSNEKIFRWQIGSIWTGMCYSCYKKHNEKICKEKGWGYCVNCSVKIARAPWNRKILDRYWLNNRQYCPSCFHNIFDKQDPSSGFMTTHPMLAEMLSM